MTHARHTRSTQSHQRARRKLVHRRAVLALGLCCLALSPVFGFFGGAPGTVYDPSNHVENIRQTFALLDQIHRAKRQIQLQFQMLRRLPVTVRGALELSGEQIAGQLEKALAGAPPSSHQAQQYLGHRYPLDFDTTLLPQDIQDIHTDRLVAERIDIATQRQLQNRVYREMSPTSHRLTTLIEASNGASAHGATKPGQTAVLGARNELLALLSAEVNQLTALRAARLRQRTTQRASEQSQQALAKSRRIKLIQSWPQ